jgi:hypothetical protein
MTKRSRDSTTASSNPEPPDRHTSHDVEGIGSQEDAEGSALKKARSFMATLVSEVQLSPNRVLILLGLRCMPLAKDSL